MERKDEPAPLQTPTVAAPGVSGRGQPAETSVGVNEARGVRVKAVHCLRRATCRVPLEKLDVGFRDVG